VLRNSGLAIRLIRRCQYRMTGRVVPGVPYKPQGDSKSAVMSLNGSLFPKSQHQENHAVMVKAKITAKKQKLVPIPVAIQTRCLKDLI